MLFATWYIATVNSVIFLLWEVCRELVQDTQVLELMLWCQNTLNHVLLHQQALPELDIQQKLAEIKRLNAQETMSQNLHLVLKQISLLLETSARIAEVKTELLARDIK